MSSLDFEHDEPDEVLPPAAPAPAQHCETPQQRLGRLVKQQAELVQRHLRATDADERERLARLMAQREVGLAYQRRFVQGVTFT